MSPERPLLNPHQWVKEHADYLYAYTIKRIADPDLARDLVQETFLAALQQVDNFKGKSTERTWLTAIIKNKIVDAYRKKSSGLTKEIQQGEHEQQHYFNAADGHWNPDHHPVSFGMEQIDPLMNKEFNQILQKCLQKLPALWMAVFTMKHIDDEDTPVICTALKVSPANFWVIIHRTKLNLRACLQKNWS